MTEIDGRQRLMQLTAGFAPTMAVFAAAELGIPDLIAAGTRSLDGLARATGADPAALSRCLRYLVGLEVLARADGAYRLAPMGEFLRSDVDGSRRANVRMMGRFAPAWSQILHSLRTGETAFSKVYGMELFAYLSANPAESAIFDSLMEDVHGPESAAISAAYDFAAFACLADIGGGNGSLLIEILRSRPALQGILFDRPDVAERAGRRIAAAGLAGRCRAVGGSFFESVPSGADGMLLRHVLHDWGDADALAILANCRRALPAGGRVLVAEAILPEDDAPSVARHMDLSMLVLAGGQERTEREYRALCGRAGLSVTKVIATATSTSLIEARLSGEVAS